MPETRTLNRNIFSNPDYNDLLNPALLLSIGFTLETGDVKCLLRAKSRAGAASQTRSEEHRTVNSSEDSEEQIVGLVHDLSF